MLDPAGVHYHSGLCTAIQQTGGLTIFSAGTPEICDATSGVYFSAAARAASQSFVWSAIKSSSIKPFANDDVEHPVRDRDIGSGF